uniref:Cyclin family protein n=1 Tax=Rhizophora mucronata TaxID=61149 RepID=A0A2P2L745_RHIMU
MGTLALDTGCVDLAIYQLLGLKELKKGDLRSPRVLMLLSSLLERSIHRNEMLSETTDIEDVVTVFHGLRAPSVSIRQYIDRIFRYSGCSPSCFVVAQIYLDRFLRQNNVRLTSLNVHRLLITSIMLAAKFNDDA